MTLSRLIRSHRGLRKARRPETDGPSKNKKPVWQREAALLASGSQESFCRVGKGRPAGSIELRVSPSPSKIPYGGFSPVRLQMDRQWRPSTTSQGLSAVHIRPMIPSYTPPQFLLPGVRDPRRDFPVLEPFGSMWHDSQQRQHVHPEALGSPSGYVVPAGHRLLRPHPPLWIPLRRLWIRGGGCCTQGNRLGVGIQRFPNLLRWTVLACRLPYPGGPEECK